MELIRKPVHYTQEGKKIFDQFHLDEDYNVPEAKEDVQKVIQGTAEVRTEDIRQVENYVRVAGKVYFKILYVTASGDPGPAALEGKIPFEEMIYAEGNEGEDYYIQNVRTEFTASVVHSRKLSLRVTVELEVEREQLKDEETTVAVESEVPVYCKKQQVSLLTLAVSKKDTYRIKETITLPGTKESIGQILLTDITGRKLDIRPSENELQIRGELLVFCMYLSGEEKVDWISQIVPYEGRIPCEGCTDGMYYHIRHTLEDTLADIRMDEDGEMRILGIEASLSLRMNLYREEETEILSDLYSLEKECVFDTRKAEYEELLMQNQSRCRLTERILLPELKDGVLQVIHSGGNIQVENICNTPEGVRAEGILHLTFLYVRADDMDPFGNWQGMIPFSWLIDCPELPGEAKCSMACHVEQLQVALAGSEEVEVKAVLAFDAFLRRPVSAEVITSVELRPADPEKLRKSPGIVGHIVQSGEDLWGLAKKYMTTVESIMKTNGLESEKIKTGDKLLIFKENMSIL